MNEKTKEKLSVQRHVTELFIEVIYMLHPNKKKMQAILIPVVDV